MNNQTEWQFNGKPRTCLVDEANHWHPVRILPLQDPHEKKLSKERRRALTVVGQMMNRILGCRLGCRQGCRLGCRLGCNPKLHSIGCECNSLWSLKSSFECRSGMFGAFRYLKVDYVCANGGDRRRKGPTERQTARRGETERRVITNCCRACACSLDHRKSTIT